MSDPIYSLSDLPELPIDALCADGDLAMAELDPVLTVKPAKPARLEKPCDPRDPGTSHHCAPNSSFVVRKYVTQVIYPKVVCYPNEVPDNQVMANIFSPSERTKERQREEDPRLHARKRFYKLSRHDKLDLSRPMFCTVHGGPWPAKVLETSQCGLTETCGPLPHIWSFDVAGMPELYMEWFGTWEDIPVASIPNLTVLMNDLRLVDETWNCCSGFKKCLATNSCIRETVPCNDNQPPT